MGNIAPVASPNLSLKINEEMFFDRKATENAYEGFLNDTNVANTSRDFYYISSDISPISLTSTFNELYETQNSSKEICEHSRQNLISLSYDDYILPLEKNIKMIAASTDAKSRSEDLNSILKRSSPPSATPKDSSTDTDKDKSVLSQPSPLPSLFSSSSSSSQSPEQGPSSFS